MRFRSLDSILSEFAVMGFEYGYSVANGDALVCWEAQFGDFVNAAQVIVDQFVSSGEDKWRQESGLVLLLPHGYEGQGPEHSSARLERFLTLAAEDNIQIVVPTTPAQYFHMLRRQMHRTVRKPLVVMTPKSLLRHPAARDSVDEFTSGGFRETIDDPSISNDGDVRRVVFCSGKVAYGLKEKRDELKVPIPIVRVEQLYPFPLQQVLDICSRYPNLESVCWTQEEPENMGPWNFFFHKLAGRLPDGVELTYSARVESASPSTGSAKIHEQEQQELIQKALTI